MAREVLAMLPSVDLCKEMRDVGIERLTLFERGQLLQSERFKRILRALSGPVTRVGWNRNFSFNHVGRRRETGFAAGGRFVPETAIQLGLWKIPPGTGSFLRSPRSKNVPVPFSEAGFSPGAPHNSSLSEVGHEATIFLAEAIAEFSRHCAGNGIIQIQCAAPGGGRSRIVLFELLQLRRLLSGQPVADLVADTSQLAAATYGLSGGTANLKFDSLGREPFGHAPPLLLPSPSTGRL